MFKSRRNCISLHTYTTFLLAWNFVTITIMVPVRNYEKKSELLKPCPCLQNKKEEIELICEYVLLMKH